MKPEEKNDSRSEEHILGKNLCRKIEDNCWELTFLFGVEIDVQIDRIQRFECFSWRYLLKIECAYSLCASVFLSRSIYKRIPFASLKCLIYIDRMRGTLLRLAFYISCSAVAAS